MSFAKLNHLGSNQNDLISPLDSNHPDEFDVDLPNPEELASYRPSLSWTWAWIMNKP
jgi:hypothetical protein